VRHGNAFRAIVEKDIDELPDLIARLLADSVERRLRRNLTRGYLNRGMVLTRVRRRIDVLVTEARLLPSKGEVFCRFADLPSDTPRNRLVRAALSIMERLARSSELRFRCRSLSSNLAPTFTIRQHCKMGISARGGWTNAAACETLGWMSAEEPIRHAEELEREVAPCSGGWTGR
jgi:5-methylcytosine-specific restriction endonuclease McrBC regulatory subunit McrC